MDDASPLCCCEYFNIKGERTHLLALCCECDELDNAVDQCLKGGGFTDEKCVAILEVISDRLRIPWPSGALKFDFEVLLPVIILYSSLYIASLDFVFTVLSLVYLPVFVLVYYVCSLRRRKKSWFFVSWASTSIIGIYVQYISKVSLKSTTFNNVGLSIGFFTVLWVYYSVVNSKEEIERLSQSKAIKNGITPVNGKIPLSSSSPQDLSCCFCIYGPFDRRKHCRICGYCVPRSDHHCVWTNCCIGHHNHVKFLLTIMMFIVFGWWGTYVSLQTVCLSTPGSFYLDCSKVYNDTSNASMFVSAFYTIIFIFSMSALLVQQLVFITFNITGDEWRRSPKNKSLWQILCTANPHYKGVLQNWINFLFPEISPSSYEIV